VINLTDLPWLFYRTKACQQFLKLLPTSFLRLAYVNSTQHQTGHSDSQASWRCTDVGSRTMIAIKISDYDDPSWFNGPTYAVVEHVFDEDALSGFERLADGTLTLGGESAP
jgi:hypothetical protein